MEPYQSADTHSGTAPVQAAPFQEKKKALFAKEVVLGVLVVISAIAAAWAFKRTLPLDIGDMFVWPPEVVTYLLLPPFIYSVLFALFTLVVYDMRVRAATLFLSAASFHALFPFENYFIGSILIGWALMMLSDWEAKTEALASTKIYIRKVVGRNLGYFFTGTALMMSFIYYSTVPADTTALTVLLPKPLFEKVFVALERPLGGIVPGIAADASIDDFIANSLLAVFKENGRVVPEEVLRDEIRKQREAYAKQSGMKLAGNELVVDVLYGSVTRWAESHAGPYRRFIPTILAVGYFLTLKALSVLYYLAVMPVAFLLMEIALGFGVLKKYNEVVEKEVISL